MIQTIIKIVSSQMVAPQKRCNRSKIVFTLLVAAFALYAGLFIYRTSFSIDGVRFFSLFDDAMISMRYAQNLADGYGASFPRVPLSTLRGSSHRRQAKGHGCFSP